MRSAYVLAASVVVHAVAMAAVVSYTPSKPNSTSVAPILELAPPEPTPVEIVFVDEADSRHDRQGSQRSAHQDLGHLGDHGGNQGIGTQIVAVAAGVPESNAPAATETAGTPPMTRSALSMRAEHDVDLALPETRIVAIESESVAERPSVETGQLTPAGGGTYKSEQGPFDARIAKDGTVDLKDGKNFHIHIAVPTPKELGDMLQAWYYTPNKPVGGLPPEGMETVKYDGDVALSPETVKISDNDGGITLFNGGFDVTDAMMRKFGGGNPYASKKLAFLDSTRDERVQIGARHRSQQLAKATQIMRGNLQRLWAVQAPIEDKKRALFELWDECEETGSEDVLAAGRDARTQVIGFIRTYLPAGSADAYTTAELAALAKKKRSTGVFQPYEEALPER